MALGWNVYNPIMNVEMFPFFLYLRTSIEEEEIGF